MQKKAWSEYCSEEESEPSTAATGKQTAKKIVEIFYARKKRSCEAKQTNVFGTPIVRRFNWEIKFITRANGQIHSIWLERQWRFGGGGNRISIASAGNRDINTKPKWLEAISTNSPQKTKNTSNQSFFWFFFFFLNLTPRKQYSLRLWYVREKVSNNLQSTRSYISFHFFSDIFRHNRHDNYIKNIELSHWTRTRHHGKIDCPSV